MFELKGHTQPVLEVNWNPRQPFLLASCSADNTARVWDAEQGRCLHVLSLHTQPVYSVRFDPSGLLLATLSADKMLRVWTIEEKKHTLVRSYMSGVPLIQMSWGGPTGALLAAGAVDGAVLLLEVAAP